MKKILVIAIIYLLGSFAAAAQTVKVNGTVIDEQNRPVEFVNVVGSTGRGGNIGQQYHAEGRPHGCSTHRYCHEEFL